MVIFRHMYGVVYVLENRIAQRVKIGMTINDPVDRLDAVNDMWLGRKVTCQICGGRLVKDLEWVPKHVLSGVDCPGGGALPLESDVSLAESYLEEMKARVDGLCGSEKGSVIRKIKTIVKRIEMYRHSEPLVGGWRLSVSFHTESAEQVELASHGLLAHRLDERAPFGEVFHCSVSEATEAIETALAQLGLLEAARKETCS
jgi:hypothetical protein